MANATLLQMVNQVQRRLREPVTAAVDTTPYASMITVWVNETKREVEDSWNWSMLRDTVVATTIQDTRAYVLTNARNRFRVLDVYNNTENYLLKPIYHTDQTINFIGASQNTGKPMYYSFNGSFEGDPVVDLFPIPDGVMAINFNLVIPQDDLALPTEQILVPSEPVVLGAYMRALVERGEDGSTQYQWAAKAYSDTLATAISQDEARLPGELIFYAV